MRTVLPPLITLLILTAAPGCYSEDDPIEGNPTGSTTAGDTDTSGGSDVPTTSDGSDTPTPGDVPDAPDAPDAETSPDSIPSGTDPVGSACAAADTCVGPAATCLADFKPLENLTEDPAFKEIGLEFPGGYCSNNLNQVDCAAGDACGTGGACFAPLADVDPEVLQGLAEIVPFDVLGFADVGICLKPCAASSECRDGYLCGVPIGDLLSLVPGASTDTFCIEGDEPPELLPTGAQCTAAAECSGTNPVCLETLKPLDGQIVPSGNPEADAVWENIGVDLPGGYCSTDPSCASDADCGAEGTCFQPLADVSQEDLDALTALNLPFDINEFATFGVCLKGCESAGDCREGYGCEIPIADLLSLVPGSSTATFCIGDGLDVGSACTADDECGGQAAVCLSEFKPLVGKIDSTGNPEADAVWEDIGLDFPGGYCSNDVSCTASVNCGPGGSCFRPLEGVGSEVLDELQEIGLPFDIGLFSNIGVCLQACTTSEECREGYDCDVPIGELLSLVEGASTTTFCIAPDPGGGPCAAAEPPCQNGGACKNVGQGNYICECTAGYTGINCEAEKDECQPIPGLPITPCQNGSACTDLLGDYECACIDGFTGKDCHIPPGGDACTAQPCVNGTCAVDQESYSCTCEDGWEGVNCDLEIAPPNPCEPSPCVQGICSGEGDQFSCDCNPGWEGILCDQEVVVVDLCDPNPCVNGSCGAAGDSFTCACTPGWEGALCDTQGCAPTVVVTYSMTGQFEIKETPLGAGNGTFDVGVCPWTCVDPGGSDCLPGNQPACATGEISFRFTEDPNNAGQPGNGPAQLISWRFPQVMYQSSAGLKITTNVLQTVALNGCGAATGTLNGTTLSWGGCTKNDFNGTKSWKPSDGANGVGCLNGFTTQGNVYCKDDAIFAGCGDGALGDGDNAQGNDYNQPLNTFEFAGGFGSFSMPDQTQIPNDAGNSSTWLKVNGNAVVSQETQSTPACLCE
ncbi:MAG: hypothetical protein ACI9WU_000581 [Myxococcota bacterium]|jgi:hypothetical protein